MGVKITVLICCFNGERFLKRALESLIGQKVKLRDFEVLFIDDGSKDCSHEIAKRYERRLPLRIHKNDINLGLTESCNKGIQLAKGDWIVRLDADDAFSPEMLGTLLVYIDFRECDFIYSNRKDIYWDKGEEVNVDLQDFNVFRLTASGIAMKRSLLFDIGGYRNLFWEEYDLYIRYLGKSQKLPMYVNKTLYYYSVYKGSMTSDPRKTDRGWEELVKEWGINKLKKYGRDKRLNGKFANNHNC